MFGKKVEKKKPVVKKKSDNVEVYNGTELARVFTGKRAQKVAESWAAERGFIVK
jgi:hypothetical protein